MAGSKMGTQRGPAAGHREPGFAPRTSLEGREPEGMGACICRAQSLRCSLETSMALLANRPHASENKKLKMRNKKIMIEKLKVPSLSNTFHKSDLRMERRQG